jgi:glycyl-tRNA synthetase
MYCEYLPYCCFQYHEEWVNTYMEWLVGVGLNKSLLSLNVHKADKLAHYAKACTDIVFTYPFGTQELMGVAARGAFDLTQHAQHSGKNLHYFDPKTNESYIPHVIEPSIGLDRLFLALLVSAYKTEMVGNEARAVLKLHPAVAPVKMCILPLLSNNDELVAKSRAIFKDMQKHHMCEWDQSGAIGGRNIYLYEFSKITTESCTGKRYRRADEIGAPLCITIDHETLADNTVTVRHRDSMAQDRIHHNNLHAYVAQYLNSDIWVAPDN